MKIIFMGTPEFAVPALNTLIASDHTVAAVITGPDKERGRGQKVSFTAVKEAAIKNNIPVLQPDSLKDKNFIAGLKSFNADLFVVVAFRILPREVFTIPSKGSFNLHGSLLPKYRGAAPIQWALIKGETETGVTTFMLEDKVDTGNILLQEKIKIDEEDDFGTLHDKMSLVGAEIVLQTVNLIENGKYELKKQDDSLTCAAPKITKEICEIKWNETAIEIHNLVRGLSPYPGAFFKFRDRIIKIYKTNILQKPKLNAGEFYQTKNSLAVGTGSGSIEILELQQEGKRRMKIDEFLRGFSFV